MSVQVIPPDFRLKQEVGPDWGSLKDSVDRYWNQLIKKKPQVFDGPIFALASVENGRAQAFQTSFRYCVAQEEGLLDFHPLGVMAWLEHEGKVLLGRRSQMVHQYPGYLELVPSGHLDKLDYLSVLTAELQEELGIGSEDIRHLRPMALCSDGPVRDILVQVSLKHLPKIHLNEELSEVLWVPKVDLQSWASQHREELVPGSYEVLLADLDLLSNS